MYCSIIDLGSNTIRLVVYKVKAHKYSKVFDEKSALGILNYIDENCLSEEGIRALIHTLNNMSENIKLMDCTSSWCFATASLRNLTNVETVISRVFEATEIQITPISGDEEAYYDFISLKSMIHNPHFIGCDLGGGSLQIVHCQDDLLSNHVSLPIGSLRMYRDFTKGFFPTPEETQAISHHVRTLISAHPFTNAHNESSLYVMGGTARAIVKLYRELTHSNQAIHGSTLTVAQLKSMKEIIERLGLEGVKVISKILPSRTLTIIPGLIVISTLAEQMNVDRIIVAKTSVRDGFLIKHMMDGDYNDKRKI